MTDAELLDDGLRRGGLPSLAEVAKVGWIDRALPFESAHFLDGFPQADGKFHFKPDWKKVGPGYARMPAIADWSADYEKSDAEHPYKLVCPPARNFLNSTFSETPTSHRQGGRPGRAHASRCGRAARRRGGVARAHRQSPRLGGAEGRARSRASRQATLIVEGIWPADRLRGEARHQHADRRRPRAAQRRRRLPRHGGVDAAGLAPLRSRRNRPHKHDGHPGTWHRDPALRKRRSEQRDGSRQQVPG